MASNKNLRKQDLCKTFTRKPCHGAEQWEMELENVKEKEKIDQPCGLRLP